MKIEIKFLFLLLFLTQTGLINAQGLKLDPSSYKNAKEWILPHDKGFSKETLPQRISYRSYCPIPRQQGNFATCVGWAAAYGALSTQQNIQMNITQYSHKWARAFDPDFIYSFIKDQNDQWCERGTSLSDALAVLENFGCKPNIWEPWLHCDDKKTFDEFTLALASIYKIEDWFAIPKTDIVEKTKLALSYEFSVLVGVQLTESFMNNNAMKYGLFMPGINDKNIGGHAMCVIGYDDNKFGGSFELMNSYGRDYGDEGFIWMKYSDFSKLVDEAYLMKTTKYKNGPCSFGDCKDTYSRYVFNNGDVYEGIISNSELDVYGAYLYSDGSFYVGGYKKGRKDGYGLMFDIKTDKFYSTIFKNGELLDYSLKSFGFSQADEISKKNFMELWSRNQEKNETVKDFQMTEKDLERFINEKPPVILKN